MLRIELVGRQFGDLTVVAMAPKTGAKLRWVCSCICGHTKEIIGASLLQGRTKSCGCTTIRKARAPMSEALRLRLESEKSARAKQRASAVADIQWGDYFTYEPDTGRLVWKVKRPGPKASIGGEVGNVNADGRYRSFVLFRKRFYTHRVIWELVNGPIPADMCIDHIDGDGINNKLSNLRITTLSGNQRNRRVGKNSRTGVVGVTHTKSGFAVACAGEYVGHYQDIGPAIAARRAAESRLGFLSNNRKANRETA